MLVQHNHKRFGSWEQALSAAGLGARFSGTKGGTGRSRNPFSDDELLIALRDVSEKIGGRPVTVEAFKTLGRMNPEAVRRRFGSWGAALERAELAISSLGRRHSDDQYFENLLTVWTYHGRQPKYGEMDRAPSSISSGAYEAKWGTWRKALAAFVKRGESDRDVAPTLANGDAAVEPPRPPDQSIRRNARRDELRRIPMGLRYRVLRRDRFRCVLCGSSPAMTPGCELHVDHAIAFSRGGRTRMDNLRALCATCNIGKGSQPEPGER